MSSQLTQRGISKGSPTISPALGRPIPYCPTATEKLCTSIHLYFPEKLVFKAILVVPVILWITCIMLGSFHHEGVNSKKIDHPFDIYDKYVFKRFGPLLPFAILFLRWLFNFPWVKPSPAAPAGARPGFSAQATLAAPALVLYGKMAALRLILYLVHVAVQRTMGFCLLSDHVFLGACICASLQVEFALAVGDVFKNETLRGPAARSLLLLTTAMLNAMVQMVTAADLYFSGRHYHHTRETNTALFAGLLLFQMPAVLWLKKARQQQIQIQQRTQQES